MARKPIVQDASFGSTMGGYPSPDSGMVKDIDANFVDLYNTTPGSAILTTKGDLAGFSTVVARIPIGSNNQVLTADNTQALGLKWAAPAVVPAFIAPGLVSDLPAAGMLGRRGMVTDALGPVFGSAVVGLGTVVVPVYDNGTAWAVG